MTKKQIVSLILLCIAIMALIPACATEVSTAFCVAEMTRNGEVVDGRITWPGQKVPDLKVADNYRLYIPCGYRNYIISDGNTKNPNGAALGDRTNPILLSLPSGKVVETYVGVYWTLNQSTESLREFIKFQKKYDALNTSMSSDGNVNSSTPGWNNMLLENFSPTLDSVARQAMQNIIKNPPLGSDGETKVIINDNMWKTQDTEQWQALANEMSNLFADNIAKRVGSGDLDLFCGSNSNTGWKNPSTENAGKSGNEFNCAPVIIEVTFVQPANAQVDSGSQSQLDANQQRYDAAKKLYGDQTECWLGIQDAIKACGETTNCTVILESNQCQKPDGSDAGGTILWLPNPSTIETEASVSPEATATP